MRPNQGAAGTGKSLFAWHVRDMFLQLAAQGQTTVDTPIPLVVLLTKPWLRDALLAADRKDHGALLEAYLRQPPYALSEKARSAARCSRVMLARMQEVESVRANCAFVFFLDGVDELGEKVALYDALGLDRWPASSFVFGSRTGFLQVRM